jgi:cysteine-rich repeat protein
MKSIMTMLILALSLLTSTIGYAVPANPAVRVDGQGITFPDNTLQTSAAILPVCQPGEVYVKANTGMLCAKIKNIINGIATCVGNNCTVSTCNFGFGNCDGLNPNVCETDVMSSATNCGACGNACTSQNECASPVCMNGLCGGTSPKAAGSNCSAGICNGAGACVTAQVCGNGVVEVEVGEQCDDGNTTSGDGCSSTCTIEPTCVDGVRNGTETDVDCGGGICMKCDSGKLCLMNLDCASGTCTLGTCQ